MNAQTVVNIVNRIIATMKDATKIHRDQIFTGTLEEKDYAYKCGYLAGADYFLQLLMAEVTEAVNNQNVETTDAS